MSKVMDEFIHYANSVKSFAVIGDSCNVFNGCSIIIFDL